MENQLHLYIYIYRYRYSEDNLDFYNVFIAMNLLRFMWYILVHERNRAKKILNTTR